MNEQEKAVLGLGVYTALADGEADQAEISFISGVAREVLGGEDEDEFISIISGLLEAHGKAVEAGAVGSLISEEADKLWKEWYSPKERVEYIRKNSYEFEFRDWQDMSQCVRGEYFAGYASELIN